MSPLEVQPAFAPVVAALVDACREHYGHRLGALAVFGSVGRGTARPDSDIDLLVVADDLPRGRLARVREFEAVEHALKAALTGSTTRLPAVSPIFKTPVELEAGSPLLLDMIEDSVILVDRAGMLRARLDRLQDRLATLGARRIWRGNAWYWDLKPDYRPGDTIEL